MSLREWSRQVRELAQRLAPRVVAVRSGRHRASGWLYDEAHVVTAEHILTEAPEVVLADGSRPAAQLVGTSPGLDLALIRLESEVALAPVTVRAATTLEPGDWVLALARSAEDGLGVSQGVVACRSGPWRSFQGGHAEHFLQPDLKLYPGYSGGPLVDAEGHWLGINSGALSRFQAVTLTPETVAREIELIRQGRPEPAYLGVGLHTVDWQGDAAMVTRLVPDSPAARAGVLLGDILLELDGRRAGGTAGVLQELHRLQAGQRVASRWIRAGEPRELELELGLRPVQGAEDE